MLGDDSGLFRIHGMKSSTINHRDYNEHTRKLVRSNSVPTHHISSLLPTQGLETPGGYSASQDNVTTGMQPGQPGLGEFRTPQSTRSGAKISGIGSKDWAKSEPAQVSPLLILENALRLATGEYVCMCMCVLLCLSSSTSIFCPPYHPHHPSPYLYFLSYPSFYLSRYYSTSSECHNNTFSPILLFLLLLFLLLFLFLLLLLLFPLLR